MMKRLEKGFTLLEVNLAIFVMATGVLGMCALYAFGFRENGQSVEDVAAVAFADAYLSPLVQGLSATNITWSQWCEIGDPTKGTKMQVADAVSPEEGWMAYVESVGGGNATTYRVRANPNKRADDVFGEIMNAVQSPYKGEMPSIDGDYSYALVATRCGAKIQLAFRAARRRNMLMSQPIIVSEVHFQGDPDK